MDATSSNETAQEKGGDNATQPTSLMETVAPPAAQLGATEQDQANQQAQQEPESKADEQAKPEGAPEKYDLKPTDGAQFDQKIMGEFEEVARDLNLSNEAAQKILDRMTPAMQSQHQAALVNASTEWANQSKADSEFGGEKLSENLSVAKKAMDKFGSDEFKSMINESGLGNHPEVIRFFYRVGKTISEDSVVAGRQTAGQQIDARSLYSASNMNQ